MKIFVLVLIVLIVLAYVAMAIVLIFMRVDSRKLWEYKNTKELLEAGKKAIEAEKRIGESYEKTLKRMHELLEGGEEC